MRLITKSVRARLLIGASLAALAISSGAARAQDREPITIAPQSLTTALQEFGSRTSHQVMFSPDLIASKNTAGVTAAANEQIALAQLLQGTGLTYRREGDTFLIVSASDPQSGSAAGDGADGTVQALIVTAQKKEENVQDVPIAISAFTEKTLEEQKIEGGFDLLKAIPNVTFSKNNFTSYNFSIRGVGTKAVSATTDPGVSVSFNNTGLIQNRLFEQEYFDIERVEVLRGPQGTLYGRNATSGVINLISAKPKLSEFDGWIKGEVGNYHTKRISAMVNIPLIEDKLAVRVAGAMTDRQGYDFNSVTDHPVNGRDLWSARLTIGFRPVESFRANLIWERFNEDDNRSRTGKQLCHRDDGPAVIGNTPIGGDPTYAPLRRALFSTGCHAGSLYDDGAFGTPNGLALPFVFGMLGLGAGPLAPFSIGADPVTHQQVTLIELRDPYSQLVTDTAQCTAAGQSAPCYLPGVQSKDMRTIASLRDPIYRAKADLFQLNLEYDLTDDLTFYSQTAYDKDSVYSFQDFNRFNTVPIFRDTTNLDAYPEPSYGKSGLRNLAPGGVFCDPQLGCSDTMAGFDISQASSKQFSQELRLQSAFDGPLNFSVGANFTKFDVLVDYYIMYNLVTAYALMKPFNNPIGTPQQPIDLTFQTCGYPNFLPNVGETNFDNRWAGCPYIDPNPVESINGEGHNYFRSKNPYHLKSAAAFGELYWQFNDALKVTAGLRYTKDRKIFTPVPSQVLMAPSLFSGGWVNKGYPELEPIKQEWGEFTGRLGVDWKPDFSFTDETMLYAFYSRGYKGGGANPPQPGYATEEQTIEVYRSVGYGEDFVQALLQEFGAPFITLTGNDYGPTFKPEFVDAFEVGAKNTLLGGALRLNLGSFFYNYKDYQVSQIRDRTAVNENFNATIWGLELETTFAPSRDFQLIANIGYLDTNIRNGESSIDIMDRTAGNSDYVVMKPWFQLPSNCVVPKAMVEEWLSTTTYAEGFFKLCGGYTLLPGGFTWTDPNTGAPYDPLYYNGQDGRINLNGGAGIRKELGGNELPNSPHFTTNIGAQYGHDLGDSWRVTVRGDAYWQSQSWARVYNDNPYDKLHGWYNLNLSVWFERPEDDLKIELYAKNILDGQPITDAFLNSDDAALTTNVFTLDPRLIGLSIKKGF